MLLFTIYLVIFNPPIRFLCILFRRESKLEKHFLNAGWIEGPQDWEGPGVKNGLFFSLLSPGVAPTAALTASWWVCTSPRSGAAAASSSHPSWPTATAASRPPERAVLMSGNDAPLCAELMLCSSLCRIHCGCKCLRNTHRESIWRCTKVVLKNRIIYCRRGLLSFLNDFFAPFLPRFEPEMTNSSIFTLPKIGLQNLEVEIPPYSNSPPTVNYHVWWWGSKPLFTP